MYSNYQYKLFWFLKIINIILMEVSNAKMYERKTLVIFQTLFYMQWLLINTTTHGIKSSCFIAAAGCTLLSIGGNAGRYIPTNCLPQKTVLKFTKKPNAARRRAFAVIPTTPAKTQSYPERCPTDFTPVTRTTSFHLWGAPRPNSRDCPAVHKRL